MSMYNMIFGKNGASDAILATLGLSQNDVGRFRNCWVEKAEDGQYRIAVYTRNGGGNRECWEDGAKYDCDCIGCNMQNKIPKHPNYLFDQDDDFDRTYATIYYSLPEEFASDLMQLAEDKPVNMSDNWGNFIKALKNENED